jgi:hypothetical protein
VIPKHHPPCAESCCGAGHSITTSTAASQKQIDAATREDWQSLTRELKKQALKPEKNRNHFKRMWKKDLQIKVKCVVPSRYAPRFCITSVVSFLPYLLLTLVNLMQHAHQARKRQQAAADAQRQKSLQEKWHAGASMWQSRSKPSAVTESQ